MGAQEQHWPVRRRRREFGDDRGTPIETDVATAAIGGRGGAADHPGRLEHLEVVGEQIRGDAESCGEFARGTVADDQVVDDGEPMRVTERSVDGGTGGEVAAVVRRTCWHTASEPLPDTSLNIC